MRLLLCLLVYAGPAAAQPRVDLTLEYAARDTLGDREADLEDRDNDRVVGILGAVWDRPDGGVRGELTFGVRNEFFGSEYPLEAAVGAFGWTDTARGVRGAGLRLGAVQDRAGSVEAMLGQEWRGTVWTARARLGGQALTSDWPEGGAALDGFAGVEGSLYPLDWLALHAGATADTRGDPLGHLGGEVRPFGSPLSAFAEYVVSTDEFRDEPFYNDFRFGLRLAFGFSSLSARDRAQNDRLFWRPVAAQ